MSMPLSFCDISARYGQTPAPQKSAADQTGWNPRQIFLDYMQKLRERQKEDAEDAEEDALMKMIDAMNASDEDKKSGKVDRDASQSLADAGKAIVDQHTEVQEDGTKVAEYVDPTDTLTIQAMLACLGDRFVFEQADETQEEQARAKETEEERLKVTETRDPSETSDPMETGKEV
jgi:hypothetical protein